MLPFWLRCLMAVGVIMAPIAGAVIAYDVERRAKLFMEYKRERTLQDVVESWEEDAAVQAQIEVWKMDAKRRMEAER